MSGGEKVYHDALVTKGPFGGWRVLCSCRWVGLGYDTRRAAQAAVDQHVSAAPPPAGGATEGSREP